VRKIGFQDHQASGEATKPQSAKSTLFGHERCYAVLRDIFIIIGDSNGLLENEVRPLVEWNKGIRASRIARKNRSKSQRSTPGWPATLGPLSASAYSTGRKKHPLALEVSAWTICK
jgi:hypothetical protein